MVNLLLSKQIKLSLLNSRIFKTAKLNKLARMKLPVSHHLSLQRHRTARIQDQLRNRLPLVLMPRLNLRARSQMKHR